MTNQEAVGQYLKSEGCMYTARFHAARIENGLLFGTVITTHHDIVERFSVWSEFPVDRILPHFVGITKEEYDAAFVKALTMIRNTHVE